MRITEIALTNWLAHRRLVVKLTPMTVVAGPNGSGKSAIGDAVRFALLSNLCRVDTKGARKQLLSDGAKKGDVSVCVPDFCITRNISDGKMTTTGTGRLIAEGVITSAIPFVLSPPLFAKLVADDRRNFLFSLMRVPTTPESMLAAMADRGLAAGCLDQLRVAKDQTIDSWRRLAAECASQARGAWKTHAGEAYGDVKASAWSAPMPDEVPTAEEVSAAEATSAHAGKVVADLQAQLSRIEVEAKVHDEQERRLAGLRNQAEQVPALEARLAETESVVIAKQQALDAAAADQQARQPGPPDTHLSCPHCRGAVDIDASGHLVVHKSAVPVVTPEYRSTVGALDVATRQRDAAKTALATAEAAAAALATIAPPAPCYAKGQTHSLREQLAIATGAADDARNILATRRLFHKQAAEANGRTEKAASAHFEVQAWLAIAAALAPDGIPGEQLTSALDPLNAALRDLSAGSAWRQVVIGTDMAITYGGRPYGLLSESEQWRTDTMLAIAIAQASGVKAVILDRFDVLEVASRRPALAWLYRLTKSVALDTVLVLGTFREPPKVPADVRVEWLGAPLDATVAAE